MRKASAIVGSSIFFLVAPAMVGGVIPGWLVRWHSRPNGTPLRFLGGVLIAAGAVVLIQAFARFVREGGGTPAPIAPTERLVVGGLYRHVRNPMYLAVLAVVAGQALVLGQPAIFAYGAMVAACFAAFVRFYEEPTLARRYGDEYEAYRRAVPAWLPRLRRWVA